jgi:hypothetical protein
MRLIVIWSPSLSRSRDEPHSITFEKPYPTSSFTLKRRELALTPTLAVVVQHATASV